MSNFQIALTVIFAAFIVIGVVLFSFFRGGGGSVQEQITIWGTVSESVFSRYIQEVNSHKNDNVSVRYVEKSDESFDREFIEALASGSGPDAILLSQDMILRHKDKIYPIPYSSISERDFKDTFIEEAELYLSSDGIFALPLIIDPLVMYWNRDIFTDALLSQAPSYWDEFFALVPKITIKDDSLNILRSAISFGEFKNINNAKEIVSSLILQAGNPIVKNDKGNPVSVLAEKFNFVLPPAEAALRFYTQFSDPAKDSYSWNRALPSSQTYFLSGDLAVYFGFASELNGIKLKNPNLNFDAAVLPQRRDAKVKTAYGKMQGFALLKSSKKLSFAFKTITMLTNKDGISAWEKVSGEPPVRRDLLSKAANNSVSSTFYTSAIISKGWLDPDREKTEIIFKDMVESITSGKARLSDSVNRANSEIQSLMPSR